MIRSKKHKEKLTFINKAVFHGEKDKIKNIMVTDFEDLKNGMEKKILEKVAEDWDETTKPLPQNLNEVEKKNIALERRIEWARDGFSSDDADIRNNPYVDLNPENKLKVNYSLADQTKVLSFGEVKRKISNQKDEMYERLLDKIKHHNEACSILPPEAMYSGWVDLQKPPKPKHKMNLLEVKSLLSKNIAIR